MNDLLPLTEVSGDEILARIAYRLIRLDYADHPDQYDEPTSAILTLAERIHALGLTQVAADLRLAGIWCAQGGTVAAWLRSRVVITTGRATKLRHLGRGPRR
jgi:hypothetical protein